MRAKLFILLSVPALVAAADAWGAPLVMPELRPSHVDAYNSPTIERPWTNQTPNARIAEQPIGEVISRRLGLVDGSAELFRYQVTGAPSDKTVLDGAIDGGGSRLKLSW